MRFTPSLYSLFATIVLLSLNTVSLKAQFTISPADLDQGEDAMPLIAPRNIRPLQNVFFDHALWRAEKARLRHERNTVTFSSSLQASMLQFENWTGGGTNSFSGLATLYFRHLYEKSKLTVDYSFAGAYGINVIDDAPFKNKDEFKLSGQVLWRLRNNWSYSASTNFRSQFSRGYKSRTEKEKISNFLSPGYFDVAGGFTYSRKDFPVKITLSPIGGSLTMVIDKEVSQLGLYGVPAGGRMEGRIGPSVDIFYEQRFGHKKFIMYRSELYGFTSYRAPSKTPIVRWENTIDIKLSRYITTMAYLQIYYQKEASTKPQYQYSFTVGLSYTFRNKEKS